MRSDWPVVQLRDAGVVVVDCVHKTPKPAESGIPYVAIPQMNDGRIDVSAARLVAREDVSEWNRKADPAAWDVLLSRRCNPGETVYVPEGFRCVVGQNLVLLRADGTMVTPPFLRWLVRSPAWFGQVQRHLNAGAVFDSLRCADIPKFRVPIPPLVEQKAIAAILGAIDDKIEMNRKTSRTLNELVQVLFKAWFVGPKARVVRHAPLSEMTEYIMSGGTPRTTEPTFWGGEIPWLSSGETRKPYVTRTEKTITQSGVEGSSTRRARAGSIVIASAGQGHTRGQTSYLAIDSYVNQSVVAVAADTAKVSDEYLFFDLSRRYQEFRQLSDSHSSRGSLTTKLLASVAVPVPTPEALREFDRIAAPAVSRIVLAETQSARLAEIRDALLAALLIGELRIPDVEKVVEEVV